MANRRAMKLFAVAVVAGASTAHAGTPTATRVDWSGRIDITAIQPRVLADGTPAAGNSVGKPSSVDLTRMELARASLAYQAASSEPIVVPRMLANARPACGNTGGKGGGDDECTAAERAAQNRYDNAYEKASTKHYAKVSAAYAKLMVATSDAVRVDPTLKARLLVNGRPACGNTMSKKAPPAFCRIEEGEQ
jgi:hypothetical protein